MIKSNTMAAGPIGGSACAKIASHPTFDDMLADLDGMIHFTRVHTDRINNCVSRITGEPAEHRNKLAEDRPTDPSIVPRLYRAISELREANSELEQACNRLDAAVA